MPQISKKVTFFRRNYFFIMGGIWLLFGITMLIVKTYDVMAYGYTIIGLVYAVVGYFKKDLALEFIRCDDEKIEIIKWEDIDRSDQYVHEWSPKKKEKIAVIYAVGNIISGKIDRFLNM